MDEDLQEPRISETIRAIEIMMSRLKWNRDMQQALAMHLHNHRRIRENLPANTADTQTKST